MQPSVKGEGSWNRQSVPSELLVFSEGAGFWKMLYGDTLHQRQLSALFWTRRCHSLTVVVSRRKLEGYLWENQIEEYGSHVFFMKVGGC
jgi:hypothetical protein